MPAPTTPDTLLLNELRGLIEQARQHVAHTANSTVTMLYWHVGLRIRREVLSETRADYGARIVATVSRQLVTEYGKGFAEKSVRRMIQFAEAFPEEPIVATLSQQPNPAATGLVAKVANVAAPAKFRGEI